MRIAVNAIFLQKDQLEGFGHYTNELFNRLVKQHPEHTFIFIFDRPFTDKFIDAANVISIVVPPPARHAISFRYWYDVKAPLALRSLKPDIWIQPYGFCSLTSSIPQLLVVHDLAFIHYPQFVPWRHRWFYKQYTPRFLAKAAGIVTVSDYSKTDIIAQYGSVEPEKVTVIPGAARAVFEPLPWEEKEKAKDGFADGRDYFLFTGGIHPRKNLLNLLKAFSLFKKWQHSNMKLLVAGRLAWQYDELVEKLKTYKYRDDVVMLGQLPDEQLAKVTASAYALVYPSFFEGFGLPVIEAMQSGVPVIASNTSALPETGGEAALYADPSDPEAIAKQMMLLYRDENLRNKLIKAGELQASKFSWDVAAESFWSRIMQVVTMKD